MGLEPAAGRGLAARLFGSSPQRTLALIRAAWPAAVGQELARRTEVLAIEGRTLRVRVPDARWRKVLHRMQRDILSRLNRLTGGLAPARLGFSEGQVTSPPAPRPAAPSAENEPLPLPACVAVQAAAIPDPEIRDRFLAVAARYLSRSRAKP